MSTRNRKNKNAAKREKDNDVMRAPAAGSVIISRGVSRRNQPRIDTVDTSTGRKIVVRNTELCHGVSTVALGGFSVTRLTVAPNITSGWLHYVAAAFSKYRWVHCKFIYIPIVPTTTNGQVIFALGYDFTDAAITTTENAQRAYRSITSPVWGGYDGVNAMNRYDERRGPGEVSLNLDVKRLGGPTGLSFYRFTSFTNFPALSNVDKNIYAPAYLDVVTSGGTALGVGNLFIEYIIELIEPINPSTNF